METVMSRYLRKREMSAARAVAKYEERFPGCSEEDVGRYRREYLEGFDEGSTMERLRWLALEQVAAGLEPPFQRLKTSLQASGVYSARDFARAACCLVSPGLRLADLSPREHPEIREAAAATWSASAILQQQFNFNRSEYIGFRVLVERASGGLK